MHVLERTASLDAVAEKFDGELTVSVCCRGGASVKNTLNANWTLEALKDAVADFPRHLVARRLE